MNELSLLVFFLIALAIVVAIVGVLAYLAAGLTLVFTEFVMQLPLLISIVMFIIFPPTLIVFLVGYGMIHFGIADKMYEATKKHIK